MEYFISCVYKLKGCNLKLSSQRNKSQGEPKNATKVHLRRDPSLSSETFGFSHHWSKGEDYSSCWGNWGSRLGKASFLLYPEDRNTWNWRHSSGNGTILPGPELKAHEDASFAISCSRVRLFKSGRLGHSTSSRPRELADDKNRVECGKSVIRASLALVMAAWRVAESRDSEVHILFLPH